MPIVIWSTIFLYPLSSLMCCVLLCFWISIGHKLKAKVTTCIKCLALIKACNCSLFNKMFTYSRYLRGSITYFLLGWFGSFDASFNCVQKCTCSLLCAYMIFAWQTAWLWKIEKLFCELPITPNARKSFPHKTLPWPITGTKRGKEKTDRPPKIQKLEKTSFPNFDNFYWNVQHHSIEKWRVSLFISICLTKMPHTLQIKLPQKNTCSIILSQSLNISCQLF